MNTKNVCDKQSLFIASLNAVPALQQRDGDHDWFPALDVTETGQEYVFEVDLPGLKAEEINLTSDSDVLSIGGERLTLNHGGKALRVERPAGAFVRHIALPPDARIGEIQATYSDGVLEVRLPRSRADNGTGHAQADVCKPEEAISEPDDEACGQVN